MADPVVLGASDLIFQVHPTEPGQDATLESLELLASDVAPALGWSPTGPRSCLRAGSDHS